MKLSIVIPVYNSEKTIRSVVDEIYVYIPKIQLIQDFEVILINDGSKDNVLDVCLEICKHHKEVKLINLSKNFGQANARMAGFNHVSGDIVATMDDDFQTPAFEISKLINCLLEENYDVVYAKYDEPKKSFIRKLGSLSHKKMLEHMVDKPKYIELASLAVFRRFIIDSVIEYQNPFAYYNGFVLKLTRNIGNVETSHRQRKAGKSSYTFKKLVLLWIDGLFGFSVKPLRMASFLGIITATISFIFLIAIIIKQLLSPSSVLGWSSIIVIISLFSGIQLFCIGILGEFIGRTYLNIIKIPQYLVKDVYNFGSEDT